MIKLEGSEIQMRLQVLYPLCRFGRDRRFRTKKNVFMRREYERLYEMLVDEYVANTYDKVFRIDRR